MSVPEAAQLIMQAGSIGKGGEVFVLDMGEPIKILDIANELIRLSGYEPELDIPISFIGARPGEKKKEELVLDDEKIRKTLHEKIMIVDSAIKKKDAQIITQRIMNGELNGNEFDNNKLRSSLSALIPEYQPGDDLQDPVILRIKPEAEA